MSAWSRRSMLAGAGASALALAGARASAQTAPGPDGAVILTVTGDISESNRGESDPERDGFFTFHEIEFDRAFAFDRAMLEDFPITEIRCRPPQYTAAATFTGPLLSDLLRLLGAEGAAIRTRALDGFAVDLSAQQIAEKEWIIATGADGRPFGIGDQGPLWLIHRPAAERVTAEEEANWPWALFYIHVASGE